MLDFIQPYSNVPMLCRAYANSVDDSLASLSDKPLAMDDLLAIAFFSSYAFEQVSHHPNKYERLYPMVINRYVSHKSILTHGNSMKDAYLKTQISGQWFYVHPMGHCPLHFSEDITAKIFHLMDYILTYYSYGELQSIRYDWVQDRSWWHELNRQQCPPEMVAMPSTWEELLPMLPTTSYQESILYP